VRHNSVIAAACKDLVTLASCARKLGRGPQTLVRWSDAGQFPKYLRIAKRKYVFAADFDDWLAVRRRAAARQAARAGNRKSGASGGGQTAPELRRRLPRTSARAGAG
jgi:hypothetical protein